MILELAFMATVHTSRPSVSKTTTHSYSAPHSSPSSSSTPSRSTRKVGTGVLKSKTTVPKAHTFNGMTYNPSKAPYTNNRGIWVYYWLMYNNALTHKKELRCFDQKHNRVSCDRDKNAWQKDW